MPKTFPGLKLGLGMIKRCCRTYLYTSINLINLKQQILSILLALGKSVSFTWMLGSVCVFIKLCVCFQALCMFSSSVCVFKLCTRFYLALCMFSGSVRVFKLCAYFHYLKSIFVFILHHFLYLQNRQFRHLDFPLFSWFGFLFFCHVFLFTDADFFPIEGIYPLFNVWVFSYIFAHLFWIVLKKVFVSGNTFYIILLFGIYSFTMWLSWFTTAKTCCNLRFVYILP